MARTPAERSQDATVAVYTSWANTLDPTARLHNAHVASPSGYAWHAKRLLGPDVDFEKLTPKQWEQVSKARHAYLVANAIKAVRARKLKRAQRLREQADAIEAAVKDDETA